MFATVWLGLLIRRFAMSQVPQSKALCIKESKVLKCIFLIILLFTPVAVWAFVKPVRVVAPELLGISCSNNICIEKISRHDEALRLYKDGLDFVNVNVGTIESNPRIIFCSSKSCFQSFGLGKRSAATIGKFGIVISPRAWKEYYVRHEIIHHLQNERLGMVKVWRGPQWFMEGMAYALSEDPRAELSEPFQEYRSRFRAWYKEIDGSGLWQKARSL